MGTEATTDHLRRRLHCLIEGMRDDFDRIEIILGALSGYCRPVPDYEPRFNDLLLRPLEPDESARSDR